MGADFAVLTVATDSSYQSLEDLMEALSADLASVNFGGGSAVGGQDHMKVMLLAQSAELDPLGLSYTPFDGGGEALTALLGGFIDVFPGDASEVIGQVESGDVRVLAALTPERLAAPLDEVPTAAELGYSAEWIVFRGFYAPVECLPKPTIGGAAYWKRRRIRRNGRRLVPRVAWVNFSWLAKSLRRSLVNKLSTSVS